MIKWRKETREGRRLGPLDRGEPIWGVSVVLSQAPQAKQLTPTPHNDPTGKRREATFTHQHNANPTTEGVQQEGGQGKRGWGHPTRDEGGGLGHLLVRL